MRTLHETIIRAEPDAVFDLAADVERWPRLDPAYRWCRVIERSAHATVFEMAAGVRGWPARWTARAESDPAAGRIVFRHLRGITRGMVVQWDIARGDGGTRVRIRHDLVMPWPLVGRLISDLIVGPVFIDWIARRTLLGVRRALER